MARAKQFPNKTAIRKFLENLPAGEFQQLITDQLGDMGIKMELTPAPTFPSDADGAHHSVVWRIKDGFVCRVRDMSDMHLMSLFMMFMGMARDGAMTMAGNSGVDPSNDLDGDPRDMPEALYDPENDENIAKVILSAHYYATLVNVEKELRHRGILGDMRISSF